ALAVAKLRLRPILMTAFAFILGVVPLAIATGAGAISRQTLGTTVLGGMLAASLLAIFLIPVSFVLVERLSKPGAEPGGRARTVRALKTAYGLGVGGGVGAGVPGAASIDQPPPSAL